MKKKYEVCVKEVIYGYVMVDAENSKKATQIALRKYNKGMVVMAEDSDVKMKTIKEITPIGF